MDSEEKYYTKVAVISVILMLVFIVVCWTTKSHFEAATYRKLTGIEVTTWDAMWVELRVIEPGKKPE
jgi:hypothetical protein